MHGWMGYDHGMGWGGGLFMIVLWVLAIIGVIVLVRWALGRGRGPHAMEAPRESAVEILEKRYARGDIDKEEYERMRRDLQG